LKKEIKVANIFPVILNGHPLQCPSGELRIINELIGYLYCFLDGHAYPDNTDKTTETIAKMLQYAKFNKITRELVFSFPKEIRIQFNLKENYTISLINGDVFGFYCNDLIGLRDQD
jgi:hypothetical protein